MRLAIFCTVVETGSFAKAADLLMTSPANVSLHIRVLEELWACRLFDRTRRGTRLTQAGRTAYEQVVRLLRDWSSLRADLGDLAAGLRGVVALGASIMQSSFTLPSLLADFHRQYPSAWVRVVVLVGSDQAEAVARGDVDLVMAAADYDPLPQSLQIEPLWSEPMALVAPPGHPLTMVPDVGLADLAGLNYITGHDAGEYALDAALAERRLRPRRSIMSANSFELRKQLVMQNLGLSVIFRRYIDDELADGRLVELTIRDLERPLAHDYQLLYRDGDLSPLAQRLLDSVRAAAERVRATQIRSPASNAHGGNTEA